MTISSSSECHQSAVVVVAVAVAAAGAVAAGQSQSDVVVFVKCDCCGLTEECTETYIAKVRDKYQGRWICGLCAEAVKYEIFRSSADHHHHIHHHHHHHHHHHQTGTKTESTNITIISTEEALNRHMNFCNKFRSSTPQDPPPNPTKHLISAMRHLLRRSLTTTTTTSTTSTIGSTPTSPHINHHHHHPRPKEIITEPRRLSRSESCFPTLAS